LAPATVKDWLDLGQALSAQRRWPEAADAFFRAQQVEPQNAAARSYLAVALLHLGRTSEAEALAGQAVAIDSSVGIYWANLGVCLFAQLRWGEAAATFHEATLRDPKNAAIWTNLGEAEQRLGRMQRAQAAFERSLGINGQQPSAWLGLASVVSQSGQPERGLDIARSVVSQFPNHAPALHSLGRLLFDRGELNEAESLANVLIKDHPGLAQGWALLGVIRQQDQARLNEAEACHRRAIECDPGHADAHSNLAQSLLLRENFEEGWREYEWRWKTGLIVERRFPQPMWAGESLRGKTILLHAEQGLGDTLQFIRYAALPKSLGGTVLVECQKPLKAFLNGCPGIDRIIGCGDELPPFDYHAPFLSLPRIARTTLNNIPANVPYLFADSEIVAYWRSRLEGVQGFRIGINWHGRGGHGRYRQRDIPLVHFLSLATVPGVRLISLQKSHDRDEPSVLPADSPLIHLGGDIDSTHGAFMDTAAIMMNLDLVISSDTAIPHLAGALGVPVWLALPQVPEWRWLLGRNDSPWYPTMRLFRQNRPGDWLGAFGEIRAALQTL